MTNIYAYLLDFELEEGPDGRLTGNPDAFVGDVAETISISDDGSVATFNICPGLTFSNGDPLDANAVKFTYDRIFGQGGITAFLTGMAAVNSADAIRLVDDLTIEFDIATPNTLLFGNMAQFGHSILNPNVVQPFMTDDDPWAHEWLANNTAGTESGPYLLERWERGNQIVLAKNPNYWNADAVQNDRVILQIIPDASSRLAQLQAGAVDIAIEIPTRDIAGLENDPNIKVERFTTRAVGYIGMNNTVAPFDNVQVRQAISYAIPYDVIINNVQNGFGI